MDLLMEIAERIQRWTQARGAAVEALHAVQAGALLETVPETAPQGRTFSLRAERLSQLRVAAVMDRFTLDSYQPECDLLEVTPENWRGEIDAFQPDLLMIESAWQGKDNLWYRKIANGSKEYFDMTAYCREKNIPIVFWNKEDPGYTDTFMPAAAMADVVFTTDIDCIKKYQRALGHNRVYHLHFAAQPKIHNPIEKYPRQDKFCFAGAYYHRYVQRTKVFDAFSEIFLRGKGLDIYDRNFGHARPEHAFPRQYAPYILGSLDPSEIDRAYKGYVYGVNMNSSSQTQTMFARRVFEMMASNTIVVGNYARGQKNYFGDLNICTDDPETLEKMLERYCKDEQTARKYRLLGLRKVLSEHLYEDRLDYIVQKVFGKSLKRPLPKITVFARARTRQEQKRLIAAYEAQTYPNKAMVLFGEGGETPRDEAVQVLPPEKLSGPVSGYAAQGFTAVFRPEDWYGPNYLLDLALTLRYGSYAAIGKSCWYAGEGERAVLRSGERYEPARALASCRSIAALSLSGAMGAEDYLNAVFSDLDGLFSADEFNYCADWARARCPQAEDLYVADQGIPLGRIEAIAEQMSADEEPIGNCMEVDKKLFFGIKERNGVPITFSQSGEDVEINSELAEGTHEYCYVPQLLSASEYVSGTKLHIIFQGNGSLNVMGVVILLDAGRKRLKSFTTAMNRLQSEDVPAGAVSIQLGLRVSGPGRYLLRRVAFGEDCMATSGAFIGRSEVLVLTNQYPSFQDLYRNAFVHKRVTAYRDRGRLVDVMRMNIYAKDGYREFEGINVVEGQARKLAEILDGGTIRTVCVHFLDEQMWSVLKYHLKELRLLVWLHGAEIQPWWRREYNFTTEKELEEGKAASEVRQAFWKEVFETASREQNIHFIFVSQYFADEVMEDNHISLRPEQYSVIHNCIDTELFHYVPKAPEHRKKVLSIKPYGNRKYANDITRDAILALSKEPCFQDMEFTLYGSGIRFEEDTAGLKKFKNVHLHKQFLPQYEIAELHRENGVFLATTRMDAQGVSRDEAMSSGLVPVASNVTAIPEFVDENCGILVPGEDPQAVADAIKRLYYDPELFLRLSEGAAKRVRGQSSSEYTIDKELRLIVTEQPC